MTQKNLARHYRLDFNTGDEATPTWTPIKGLSSIVPSFSGTDANTKDFDSNGWDSHLKAGRGMTVECSGFRLENNETGERDPGQEAVEVYAQAIDHPSVAKQFRIVRRADDTVYYRFFASASCTPFGGGADDASTWSATIVCNGEPEINPVDTP